MGVEWPSFLHLCIFGACRCITTALFPVAVVSARVVERSDSSTSSHPMIPVLCLLLRGSHARPPTQCIVRIFTQLQSSQLAMLPARSELSAILPFELRRVCSFHFTQTLNSSSSAILLLGMIFRELLVTELLVTFNKLSPTTHTCGHVRPGPLGSLPFCGFISTSPGTSERVPRCLATLGCSIR